MLGEEQHAATPVLHNPVSRQAGVYGSAEGPAARGGAESPRSLRTAVVIPAVVQATAETSVEANEAPIAIQLIDQLVGGSDWGGGSRLCGESTSRSR